MNTNRCACWAWGAGAAIVLVALGFFPMASLAAAPAVPPESSAGPAKVVAQFDAALIGSMKAGKKAGIEGRMSIMQRAVESAFDLSRISQAVLGHYWAGFSQEQQKKFSALLGKLTVVSYAANFDSYANQRFTITAVRRRGDSAFVSTRFSDPSAGQTHTFAYELQSQTQGHWKIVNVIADGVSDVAIKRAEYMDLLSKGSFSDLVDALQKQIKRARQKA